MSEGLFNQPFVYCGVCHRQSNREDPLHLTSCAHTLCSEHLNTSQCPICQSRDVMAIKLIENKQLPQDIRNLFQPMSTLLENLYNVSQFQSNGLINQCQYYQENCIQLREKCSRQRQLLFQAKQELDSVARLKDRITELEAALARYAESSGRGRSIESSVFTPLKPLDTVDLTVDGVDDVAAQRDEQSFLHKLKSSSSLKHKLQRQMQIQPLKGLSRSQDLVGKTFASDGAIAESTQLNGSASTAGDPYGRRFNSSFVQEGSGKSEPVVVANSNHNPKRSGSVVQSQFPSALNKLRIVKRNHTYNNPIAPSRGTQGLTPHMRSSGTVQTQTGLLMRSKTSRQRSAGSETLAGKGTNNRFRRIR